MLNWWEVLMEPAKLVFMQIAYFFRNILTIIIVLVVGWIIARFVKSIILNILKVFKIDDIAQKAKVSQIISQGGVKYTFSELLALLGYWLILLTALVVAVNSLGLTVAAELLNKIILYIPNIIISLFILLVGIFFAGFISNLVRTTIINAGLSYANLMAKFSEVVVVVFAILMVLNQLGIAARLIEIIIAVVLAALGLAFALAFGLGCKDIAGRFISNLIEKLKR